MELVAISSLSSSSPIPPNTAFSGLVTLLWPYSSTTGQCALLLADPDARKRYQNGQVRVRFSGPSARCIARSKISIGDEVEFSLTGARWVSETEDGLGGAPVRTPGKSVDGELIFKQDLECKVRKEDWKEQMVLQVEESDIAAAEAAAAAAAAVVSYAESNGDGDPSTPAPRRRLQSGRTSGVAGFDAFGVAVYSSPAFMKRLRLSEGSFYAAGNSPFTTMSEDDELDTEAARKRRRVSYRDVTHWKFDGRDSSPEKDDAGVNTDMEAQAGDDGTAHANGEKTDVTGAHQETSEIASLQRPVSGDNAEREQPEGDSVMEDIASQDKNIAPQETDIAPQGNVAPQEDVALQEDNTKPQEPLQAKLVHPEEAERKEENVSATGVTSQEESASDAPMMAPPPLPRLQMPTALHFNVQGPAGNLMISGIAEDPLTPRLQPVGNQDLPLPSPFPTSAKRLGHPTPTEASEPDIDNTTTVTEQHTIINPMESKTVEEVTNIDEPVDTREEIADPLGESESQDEPRPESRGIQIVELDYSDSNDEHVERMFPEKSMTPFSHVSEPVKDSISVASYEEEEEEDAMPKQGEELQKGDGETTAQAVKTPIQPARVVFDTFRGMGHVPSPPVIVRDVEDPSSAKSQEKSALDVEMTTASEPLSPSPGSEADISSNAGYDEDVLVSLQASESSSQGEAPDWDMLAEDMGEEIVDQDLKALMEQESSSDDELVHDSDEEKALEEDTIMERSDDESEDAGGESREEDVQAEIWGDEDSEDSDEQSDAGSFESQVTPTKTLEGVGQGFGLDGAGFSKGTQAKTMETAEPSLKTSEDVAAEEEDAWQARDAALHSMGVSEPIGAAHASTMPLSSTVKDEPMSAFPTPPFHPLPPPSPPRPSSKHEMTVVELLSDTDEEDRENENDDKPEDDVDVDEAMKDDVSEPDTPRKGPSAAEDTRRYDTDSGTFQGNGKALAEKGRIQSNQLLTGHDDIPNGSDKGIASADVPKMVESGADGQSFEVERISRAQHPSALELSGEDQSAPYPDQSPYKSGGGQQQSSQVKSLRDAGIGQAPPDVNMPRDDQLPVGTSSPSNGLTETAIKDSSVEVGSQTLGLPATDTVASVLEPASESAQQEPDDKQQLTSSSFMTLNSSSPSPAPEPRQSVQYFGLTQGAGISQVEQIDLSQTEPDYGTHAPSQSLRMGTQRNEPVSDSVGSPATTLFPGSTGANSRAQTPYNQETAPEALREAETPVQIPQFSQDLGLSQSQAIRPDPIDTATQNGQKAIEDDETQDSVDDELLASYVQVSRQSAPELVVPATGPLEDVSVVEAQSNLRQKKDDSGIVADMLDVVTQNEILGKSAERGETENGVSETRPATVPSSGEIEEILLPQPSRRVSDEQQTGPATRSEGEGKETLHQLQREKDALPQQSDQKLLETPVPNKRYSLSGKSSTGKMNGVPKVISAWFTPRRSSGAFGPSGLEEEKSNAAEPTESRKVLGEAPRTPVGEKQAEGVHEQCFISPIKVSDRSLATRSLTSQGLQTPLSYYSPLATVETHVNQSSATVDVIAVSTGPSSAAVRAKSGPKDFFTILCLVDPSSLSSSVQEERQQAALGKTGSTMTDKKNDAVRVEVYRPWKGSLPVVEAGDVVLLRDFVVKSRENKIYLLSNNASSWCVWRFTAAAGGTSSFSPQRSAGDGSSSGNGQDMFKAAWARGKQLGAMVREEIKGPPLDVGAEERQRAKALRLWWEREQEETAEQKSEKAAGKGEEDAAVLQSEQRQSTDV